MNGFSKLDKGLYLPNRKIFVEWGAEFASLETGADDARHWVPHGHNERYGQILWKECLVPFQSESMRRSEIRGSVTAYVRGDKLTVRRFSIEASDKAWLKDPAFQYGLWMQQLSKLLGVPEVPTKDLDKGVHIVPPCIWRQKPITVTLSYSDVKGTSLLQLEVAHDKYAL